MDMGGRVRIRLEPQLVASSKCEGNVLKLDHLGRETSFVGYNPGGL